MSFYTTRRTSALAAIALMAAPVSASAQDAMSDSWHYAINNDGDGFLYLYLGQRF